MSERDFGAWPVKATVLGISGALLLASGAAPAQRVSLSELLQRIQALEAQVAGGLVGPGGPQGPPGPTRP